MRKASDTAYASRKRCTLHISTPAEPQATAIFMLQAAYYIVFHCHVHRLRETAILVHSIGNCIDCTPSVHSWTHKLLHGNSGTMNADEEMTLGKAKKGPAAKDTKAAAKTKAEQTKKRPREESDDDDDEDDDASVDSSSSSDSDSDGMDEDEAPAKTPVGTWASEPVCISRRERLCASLARNSSSHRDFRLVQATKGAAKGKAAAKPAAKASAKKATPKSAKATASAAKAVPKSAAKSAKTPAAAKGKAKATPATAKSTGGKKKAAPAKEAEDDESEEEEEDEPGSGAAAAGASSAGAPKGRAMKALKPADRLEVAMKAHKWWEAPTLPKGIKWKTMEHAGVVFPPAYKPHCVRMRYEGKDMDLTPAQEELATYYAAIAPDGPQLGNPKTARVFNKNFWREFTKVLGPGHGKHCTLVTCSALHPSPDPPPSTLLIPIHAAVIQKFEACDFQPMRDHLKAQSEARKAASKEEKERNKEEKQALALRHGFALVDGHIEKMGNYMVEPPGLFRGRGEHPKMGVLKSRIAPEDITINVAHMACVPPCPLPGHSWKRVVHDPSVTWLAYWRDPVGDHHKYVFLAASSSFKGRADREKYEKARRLKQHIDKIRAHYEKLLRSEEEFERQSGTAMWIIDRLALRVGGEKDEDEADTVGCCSLRVEHMSFPGEGQVTLDFLGKDSMRYFNTISLARYGEVGAAVWKNLRRFTKGKKAEEDIFDMLNPSRLNEQLDSLMPGLSAKVFRTYNASITLEKELEELPVDTPVAEKFLEYQRANREVAILCNHQRTVPKAFAASYAKMEDKAKLLRSQLEELNKLRAELKGGKGNPPSFVAKKGDEEMQKLAEKAAAEGLAAYEAAKAAAAAPEGAGAGGAAPVPLDKDREKELKEQAEVKTHLKRIKEEEAHRWPKVPSLDAVEARITMWDDRLDSHELNMRDKDENKTVALGTSKINYMDPRISVAWCKRVSTVHAPACAPAPSDDPCPPHPTRPASPCRWSSPLSECLQRRCRTSSHGLWE